MPKAEIDLSFYCDTNTLLRAYINMWDDQLLAMGLVHHTDTGQLDPDAAVIPTGLNQTIGYIIYRFDDDLQGTKPVYIKVLFKSVISGSAISGGQIYYTIAVSFQVGSSTNGAGTIVNDPSSVRVITYNGATGASNTTAAIAAANKHLFSGDANRIIIVRGANSPVAESFQPHTGAGPMPTSTSSQIRHGLFSLERTHEANGDDTDEGLLLFHSGNMIENGNNAYHSQVILFGKQTDRIQQRLWPQPYLGNTTYNSTFQHDEVSPLPLVPMYGGRQMYAPKNLMGFLKNDFMWTGKAVDVEVYGAMQKYRPINDDLFRTVISGESAMASEGRTMIWWPD